MVYVRKRKKNVFFRVAVAAFALLMTVLFAVRYLNGKLDEIVTDMVEEGLKNTITEMINEAVSESMKEGDYGDILRVSYASDGKVRSMTADSVKINLLRADVSLRISEKLYAMEKFYVDVDISNVFDDAILLKDATYVFTVDVVPVGGIETDVKSEFISVGINQTNYKLNMNVKVGIMAIMLITNDEINVSTSVNIAEMLVVGDVPTVYLG